MLQKKCRISISKNNHKKTKQNKLKPYIIWHIYFEIAKNKQGVFSEIKIFCFSKKQPLTLHHNKKLLYSIIHFSKLL